MVKKKQPRQKHVPMRTCVGCRTTQPKRDLVRVVHYVDSKTGSDSVVVDETGKLSGRGAYLCRRSSCWQQALNRGSLARALRTQITPEAVAALHAYAESFSDTTEEDSSRRTVSDL